MFGVLEYGIIHWLYRIWAFKNLKRFYKVLVFAKERQFGTESSWVTLTRSFAITIFSNFNINQINEIFNNFKSFDLKFWNIFCFCYVLANFDDTIGEWTTTKKHVKICM